MTLFVEFLVDLKHQKSNTARMKNTVFNYFGIAIAFLVFSTSIAQNSIDAELQDFVVVIETSDKEVKLTCKEGCAWEELTIKKKDFGVDQAIDATGKTTISKHNSESNAEKGFLFTIKKNAANIVLQGIEGTKWEELTYSCTGARCLQTLNQFGMPL